MSASRPRLRSLLRRRRLPVADRIERRGPVAAAPTAMERARLLSAVTQVPRPAGAVSPPAITRLVRSTLRHSGGAARPTEAEESASTPRIAPRLDRRDDPWRPLVNLASSRAYQITMNPSRRVPGHSVVQASRLQAGGTPAPQSGHRTVRTNRHLVSQPRQRSLGQSATRSAAGIAAAARVAGPPSSRPPQVAIATRRAGRDGQTAPPARDLPVRHGAAAPWGVATTPDGPSWRGDDRDAAPGAAPLAAGFDLEAAAADLERRLTPRLTAAALREVDRRWRDLWSA
jgi:hypothetical protein